MTREPRHPIPGPTHQRKMSSRPLSHRSNGGIDCVASSWMSVVSASMSYRSNASACRAEVHRPCAALPSVEHVEADVRRNPVEPGPERRPSLEAIEAPPRPDQRLLHRILRVERSQHPVAERCELHPVLLEPGVELV